MPRGLWVFRKTIGMYSMVVDIIDTVLRINYQDRRLLELKTLF